MGTGPPAQVRLRPLMFALTSRRCKKRTLRPLLQVAQARLQVPSGRPCLLYHSRRKVGCPRHIKVRIPTDESNAGTRAAGVFVNVGGIDIYPLQPRRRSPNALMTLATILGTGASVLRPRLCQRSRRPPSNKPPKVSSTSASRPVGHWGYEGAERIGRSGSNFLQVLHQRG